MNRNSVTILTKPSAQEAIMRQSTHYVLTAGVAVVTATLVTMFGLDAALAQTGNDIAGLATGTFENQIGGAGTILKQGSVIFGAAMGAGGVAKFYGNAKDGFKDGAKGFVTPAVMALAGGAMMAVPYLTSEVGVTSLGASGTEQLDQTTGGQIGW